MAEVHEGGCPCGSVRVRTIGPPVKTAVCQCRFCRQFGSGAFMVDPIFPKTNVSFEGSAISTCEQLSTERGRLLHVQFCPKCGSRIGLTLERFPELQVVCGDVFDEPNWFRQDWHIFTGEAVGWMV